MYFLLFSSMYVCIRCLWWRRDTSRLMAFEVPTHLRRQGIDVNEVAVGVLSKLTNEPFSGLSVSLADRWIIELDDAISATRV